MEYRTDSALPPYAVSRLAVKRSDELDEKKSWRHGALLRRDDICVLAVEDERTRSVTVSLKGAEHTAYTAEHTAYLLEIRKTLDSIFDDYKSSSPELNVEMLLTESAYSAFAQKPKLMVSERIIIIDRHHDRETAVADMLVDNIATYVRYGMNEIHHHYGPNYYGSIGKIYNNSYDYSKTANISIQFQNCAVDLQECLNFMARDFRKTGDPEGVELAGELEETAFDLGEAKKVVEDEARMGSLKKGDVANSLQGKGLLVRLKNLHAELINENSELWKKAGRLKKGLETVRKLCSYYDAVAKLLPFVLPQIPEFLLEKK
jgi:hypothetical protein